MTTPRNLPVREAEIREMIATGKNDEARSALFDLIVECAGGGDFENASRFRDLLYEVDPMALQDIIKANELIEEAMNGAVSDEFNQAWTGLREALSEEEFLALYHSLTEHSLDKGKPLVKAGSRFDGIIMVTRGTIGMACDCSGRTVELQELEPGMIVEGNCVHPSLWTLSLTCLSQVCVHILRRKPFEDLLETFPGLDAKLAALCRPLHSVWQQLREQEKDRRMFERTAVSRKITFQVMKNDSTPVERVFRGELLDISRSGLAFVLRIAKRENRRMLFDRRLSVIVDPDALKLRCTGEVVAVSCHDIQNHDYAVHVAFHDALETTALQPLLPGQQETGDLPVSDPPDVT